MAKANKKSRDVKDVTTNMKKLENILNDIVDQTQPIMPLFADSLNLSKKILKMYKEAFIHGSQQK